MDDLTIRIADNLTSSLAFIAAFHFIDQFVPAPSKLFLFNNFTLLSMLFYARRLPFQLISVS
jgi:hypothetical protein